VAAAAGDESNDRVNRVERVPILCCASRGQPFGAAVVKCVTSAPVAIASADECLRLPVARQGGMSRLKRLSLRAPFVRLHSALACGSPVAPLRYPGR
jgi:hypothetical protein